MIQCSKMANFNCTESSLTSKILPAVQWCQLNQVYYIVRCWVTSLINLLHRDKHRDTHTRSQPKRIIQRVSPGKNKKGPLTFNEFVFVGFQTFRDQNIFVSFSFCFIHKSNLFLGDGLMLPHAVQVCCMKYDAACSMIMLHAV